MNITVQCHSPCWNIFSESLLFPLKTNTLCFSGAILGAAFYHMKYKEKNEKGDQKDAKDKDELDRLA